MLRTSWTHFVVMLKPLQVVAMKQGHARGLVDEEETETM